MTTPNPQGSGFLSNLLGGAAGTLAGTNPLQSSIDQLTNAVNRLTTAVGAGTLNAGSASYGQQQQAAATTSRFPSMNTPGMNRQPGIGGGGPRGTGNISAATPFGRMGMGMSMIGSALSNYGQSQMPFQLGLNAYASMSMMGMNNAGMGNYGANFSTLSNQPGLPITSSPLDYLGMMQNLSFLGGAPNYMSTSLGRAGFGASAAFGMTNPSLSGAMSANLAQQVYNPMLSMRMRLMGYNTTPRVMGSGMPQSIGNISASLIQGWYGQSKVNPAQLYKTLSMGGKGFTNLQYLGLNPQQIAPLLEGFNRLFNAGYSPEAASTLFSQAASNNPNISRQAQAKLTKAGVTSVSSDIQKLRNNQSQITQRSINVAQGFDAALTSATDTLQKFNSILNSTLTGMHLNGALGAGGALGGILSGTSHGSGLLGLGGSALMLRGLFGGGSLLGGGAGLSGLGGGGMAGASGMGMLGPLGIGIGAGALVRTTLNSMAPSGTAAGNINRIGSMATGWGLGDWLIHAITGGGGSMPNTFNNNGRTMPVNIGGGAAAPTSSQQQAPGGRNMMSNISSSAVKAVADAKSQLGVPYVWGGEQPGVGFDCSGLVQWAYKQAGVSLPRTSQLQWSSLKNKRVPLSQVQEGDIVFAAGSDGTPTSPGHEGLMINRNQLIQAPHTGADVQIIGFNPRAWVGAARPSGKGNFSIANTGPGNTLNTGSSALGLYGNTGAAMSLGGYGSVNEVDAISSMGGFMGAGVPPFFFAGAGNALGTTSSNPGSKIGGRGPAGNGSRQIAAEKAFAMQLLKARGWGSQFGALNSIIMAESSWRWNAQNASGAYGIPQALPASKMSAAGKDWRTNPDTQLRWMIDDYIPKVYGTPANAWAFHQRNGWYGGGGRSQGPGIKVVGDRGPEIQIDDGAGGSLTINNAQTMSLLKSISNPQQTPWKNFSASQYGGQVIHPGQNTGSGVSITIAQGAISVTMSSTNSDAQSTGRAIAQEIATQLGKEELLTTIAQGSKN